MIDTSLDSFNLYFLIAVIQGVVLSAIIVSRKPLRQSNVFLGLLIFLFSLSLLHLILEESIHAFNSRFPVPMDFSLAFGPLAYLHVLSIKRPKERMTLRKYLHFVPTLLIDGLLFILVFTYIRSNEEWAYANVEKIQTIALSIISLGLLQLSSYTYLIYREAKTIQTQSKDLSSIGKWLKTIMWTWLTIIGFLAFAVPVALVNIELVDENSHLLYKPLGIIIGVGIYGLGYLYLLKYLSPINAYLDRSGRIKFSKPEINQKKDQLIHTLREDKLYLSESISVAELAEHLNWPVNDVSLIISESLNTNFNDLINSYRVVEFKSLVEQSQIEKYSIDGLARQAGFGSKASFYRAFKKEMGITPSEYVKSK